MDFPAWDPVLFDIAGFPIALRWYGLMYVVGFVVAQWIMVRLARARFFPIAPEQAPDLILYCVFGVLLGGRTGYAVFYDHAMLSPAKFVQVWGGGLSFHGGLLGVVIALWLFARKHQLAPLRIADVCALAVTPGIFAVRMANFINGELYGRIVEAGDLLARWGMRFPTDPAALDALHISDTWTMRDKELCIQVAYHHRTWESVQELLSSTDDYGRKIDWQAVRPFLDWETAKAHVPFRHPSQLYEGFGEGILLGLVLLAVWLLTRRRPLKPFSYGAVFLIGYAAVRFCIEFLREPDRQFKSAADPVGRVLLGMTMGQTLCAAMALIGVLMLVFLPKSKPPEAPQ
jgi:phosphatidylglycerol:prolipoprotein diacylglycerol transferase